MQVTEAAFLSLPDSLRAWRHIEPMKDPEWAKPRETLRSFFKESGYELFCTGDYVGDFSAPNTGATPAPESFDLHGERSDHHSEFPPLSQVFAARDRMNRDVVIKLISKGTEGEGERQILELLNSEPLLSDSANATVCVLEFIEYAGYCFAVMPFCNGCDDRPFLHASECLEFAEQVLEAVSFLHEHRIAHLDISSENILVNHYGKLPPAVIFDGGQMYQVWPPLEWCSTFPCFVVPFPQERPHRAPETLGTKAFNPLAADVYQTARFFYGWFPDVAHDIPGLLQLLQEMSSYNPSRRITAAMALTRLRSLRDTIPDEKLKDAHERVLLEIPDIPRSKLVMLHNIVETGNWTVAFHFMWGLTKNWLQKISGSRLKL